MLCKYFLTSQFKHVLKLLCKIFTGLFPAILGKGPWPKLGKNDRLNIMTYHITLGDLP